MSEINVEGKDKIALALAKAQGQMQSASKDAKNKFFGSNYADLSSVWDACRKPLSDNGLSVVQCPNGMDSSGKIVLETYLLHESGQYMKSVISMKPKDESPHSYGSTLTYMRRYSLSAMVGVIQDDDDGNTGTKGDSGYKPNKTQQVKQTTYQRRQPQPIPQEIKDNIKIHSATAVIKESTMKEATKKPSERWTGGTAKKTQQSITGAMAFDDHNYYDDGREEFIMRGNI